MASGGGGGVGGETRESTPPPAMQGQERAGDERIDGTRDLTLHAGYQ